MLELILGYPQFLWCQLPGSGRHRLARCGNLVFNIVPDWAVVVVVHVDDFSKLGEEFVIGVTGS